MQLNYKSVFIFLCILDTFRVISGEKDDLLVRKKKGNNKQFPRNCNEIKKGSASKTYTIYPCDDEPSKPVEAYCDMDDDGGGWTVIQRRDNYEIQQDFYLTWNQYKLGFGDVKKDFWLGNDNIHCLTKQSYNEINIDLEKFDGVKGYANYDFFYIADADGFYKLEIGKYSGTAGDSLRFQNLMQFTTKDADHDPYAAQNCAQQWTGAWWYKNCHHSNLNGLYNGTSAHGVIWYAFTGSHTSLKAAQMKIRPKY